MNNLSQLKVEGIGGKYLTFLLSSESYGIALLKIREIIQHTCITAVARMPGCVRGIISHHGGIIPVVDLRLKFGMGAAEGAERTCVIIVRIQAASRTVQMGLAVDDVEGVTHVADADIEETPDFGAALDSRFILGMARIQDRVKTLLDIDRVLTSDAVGLLEHATAN